MEENLMFIERQKADSLRKHVVDLLRNETEKLSDLARDLPFLLDSRVSKHYSSIAARLADMSKVDTYAGNLEMFATGYLLRHAHAGSYVSEIRNSFSLDG